ncbi:hypothetical protein QAD02_013316 [Eretmocerus hayati]|uniref:Uncharacterized protein n=1 Tax=Eretmocerus hayati TaxID=131215 RepID=A0ACC2P1U1_9HYME|nr:hypothetical protein QAD02_013316 [Eretmocerus hayati]
MLISDFSERDGVSLKFVCEEVTFRGILYRTGMSVVIGTNNSGDFAKCKIELICVQQELLKYLFHRPDYGVYDLAESNSSVLGLFPYSYLLPPEPLLGGTIKSRSVFFIKYVPFKKLLR